LFGTYFSHRMVKCMQDSQSRAITFVAIFQFVPLVLFPWQFSAGMIVIVVVLLALAAFLGWALLQRQRWGITLTIFCQGLNVIVRIITIFSNVYDVVQGVNVALLLTYIVSAILSVLLLTYIDRPDVRLLFES
jgi:hypothetical protein